MELWTSAEAAISDLGFETTEGSLPVFLGDTLEDAAGAHAGLQQLRGQTQWCEGAILSALADEGSYGDAVVETYAGKVGIAPSTARSWRAVYNRYAAMPTDARATILGWGTKLSYSHYREAHERCAADEDLRFWLQRAHDASWTVAHMCSAISTVQGTTGSASDDDDAPEEPETEPAEDGETPPTDAGVFPSPREVIEMLREELALRETIIAGLVYAAAAAMNDDDPYTERVVIPRWAVEEPPPYDIDDDPFTGDWIYQLVKEGGG
jgi:hypothetical protein